MDLPLALDPRTRPVPHPARRRLRVLAMTDPGFVRSPEKIREALIIAGSRLTLATQNRDQALAAAEKADADVLTYERHVEMCRRSLDGLLDEMVWVRKRQDAAAS